MAVNLIALPPRTLTKRDKLWHKFKGKCYWCGIQTRLTNGSEPDKATVDHVLPRYKGGTNDSSNVVLSCNLCNNRRNYEDHHGLADGALMDIYKRSSQWRDMAKRVCLTGDEKKAILSGSVPGNAPVVKTPKANIPAIDVVRAQRDQALKELAHVRAELRHYMATVATLEEERKNRSLWRLIRLRIAEFIRPKT